MRFAETRNKISYDEYFSIVSYLNKMLAIGVEMERPCAKPHSEIAPKLHTVLDGSSSSLLRYKQSPAKSKFNVNHIYNDGSVSSSRGSGVEIVFTATTENFLFIREKIAAIEAELDKLTCEDYHYSCSNHISVMTLQDRVINPIVLKNIIQLSRAFSAGLLWLGAGDKEFGVRQRISSYADPQLSFTPIERNSSALVSRGKMKLCHTDKEGLIEFGNENSLLSGLFVEFRHPDGFRVPSAIAANMILVKAIVHKAVELSTQGVLEVDSLDHWQLNKTATQHIMENKLQHFSPTNTEATATLQEWCRQIAKKLIEFVIPQLKSVDSNAIETLQSLAQEPVFLRKGNHTAIEKSLRCRINCQLNKTESKIVAIVLSKEIVGNSAADNRKKIAEKVGISLRLVEHSFTQIKSKTGQFIVYDSDLKSYRVE